jgi:hypothetical protein
MPAEEWINPLYFVQVLRGQVDSNPGWSCWLVFGPVRLKSFTVCFATLKFGTRRMDKDHIFFAKDTAIARDHKSSLGF